MQLVFDFCLSNSNLKKPPTKSLYSLIKYLNFIRFSSSWSIEWRSGFMCKVKVRIKWIDKNAWCGSSSQTVWYESIPCASWAHFTNCDMGQIHKFCDMSPTYKHCNLGPIYKLCGSKFNFVGEKSQTRTPWRTPM